MESYYPQHEIAKVKQSLNKGFSLGNNIDEAVNIAITLAELISLEEVSLISNILQYAGQHKIPWSPMCNQCNAFAPSSIKYCCMLYYKTRPCDINWWNSVMCKDVLLWSEFLNLDYEGAPECKCSRVRCKWSSRPVSLVWHSKCFACNMNHEKLSHDDISKLKNCCILHRRTKPNQCYFIAN